MQRSFEAIQRGSLAFGQDFDPAIREVPDETREPLAARCSVGEDSKPDTVHMSADEIPTRNHHERGCDYSGPSKHNRQSALW